MFDPQVNIVGNSKGVQSTIERLASKAKHMKENYLSDDIMDAVLQKIRKLGEPTETHFNTKNMGQEMKDRIKILEKLVKVDTNKVVNKVAEEAMSIAYQLHSGLENLLHLEPMKVVMELASKKSNVTMNFNDLFTSITDAFGDLSLLLSILNGVIEGVCVDCPNGPNCTIPEPLYELACVGLPNLLTEFIRLFDCFGTYDEKAFEDGIEWLTCIYECP